MISTTGYIFPERDDAASKLLPDFVVRGMSVLPSAMPDNYPANPADILSRSPAPVAILQGNHLIFTTIYHPLVNEYRDKLIEKLGLGD
jgi:hypothetical protein